MISAKKFYMLRHGQSVANKEGYMSGNLDVALTDLGRQQADEARQVVEALQEPPRHIIHSHLQRARHTAEIINHNLKLPLHETNLLGEVHLGAWEKQSAIEILPRLHAGEYPPGGETLDAFAARVKKGLNWALSMDGSVLIACHGGVFRGFNHLYRKKITPIENCVLYEFIPDNSQPDFPWVIEKAARD